MDLQIITHPHYHLLPWKTEELKDRLNVLFQDLKPGLEVTYLAAALESTFADLIFAVDMESVALVGYAELHEWRSVTGACGYVENVVVSRKYQHQGIGKKLGETLLKRAQERELQQLWLHSGAWRTAAQALYKSLGFTVKDTLVLTKHLRDGA